MSRRYRDLGPEIGEPTRKGYIGRRIFGFIFAGVGVPNIIVGGILLSPLGIIGGLIFTIIGAALIKDAQKIKMALEHPADIDA